MKPGAKDATTRLAGGLTRAVRIGCALVALGLTGLWFADVGWNVFLNHEGVSGFLWLAGGAVTGALATIATAGRTRLVILTFVAIVAITVAAFIVTPWDEEAEGGAALILWWALLAVVAMLACLGLIALYRRRAAIGDRGLLRVGRRPGIVVAGVFATTVIGAVVAIMSRGEAQSPWDSPSVQRASEREAARLIRQAERLHLEGRISFTIPREGVGVRLWAMTMNADGSGLRRITPKVSPNLEIDSLAGTPDGSRLAFWHGNDIYAMDSRGRGVKRISRLDTSSDPAWSPNGKKVAFGQKSSCEEVNGQVVTPCHHPGDGIYVANVDGSGARMVAPTDDGTDAPTWSPDGKRLVFTRLGVGSRGLWVARSDGSGLVEQLTTGSTGDYEPAWSPDGRLIASNCGPVDGGSLCVVRPDGIHRRTLASLAVTYLTWSPDGRWIVFLAAGNDPESKDGLWVIRRDGTKLTQVLAWRRFVRGVGWIIPDVIYSQPVWTRS